MTKANTTVASPVGDKFEAPRPSFPKPANEELMVSKERDNTPARPLDQKVAEGDKLALKIQEAQRKAELAVQQAMARREGKKVPVAPRNNKKAGPVTHIVVPGPFTPGDVCKDAAEFVVRTRSSDIHSSEMKALFWANGGEKYLRAGLGYAAAFSNLRTDKQKEAKGK